MLGAAHVMQANEKNGSFYLQSKIYRWVLATVAHGPAISLPRLLCAPGNLAAELCCS